MKSALITYTVKINHAENDQEPQSTSTRLMLHAAGADVCADDVAP